MVVRELLAVFGIKYDGQGEKRARQGLNRLRSDVDVLAGAMASVLQAAAIAAPFAAFVKMGSAAKENLNVLGLAFEDNAESVRQWAREQSEVLGRSRFELEKTAGELGAFLKPMLDNADATTEMSTSLAVLAEDLTSVRDLKPGEALTAFRSALSGETEAIKRFGVGLNEIEQKNEALRLGWGANVKELTKAQKAQIRYNIIMRDLSFVQGDAAKTRDDFANSLRDFRGILRDVGTEFGLFLLPALEDFLKIMKDTLRPIADSAERMRQLANESEAARAVIVVLASVVGLLIGGLLIKVALLAGAFLLAVLAVDEFLTALKGGKTVMGDFSEWLDSLTAPEFFNQLPQFTQWLILMVQQLRKLVDLGLDRVISFFGGVFTGDWNPMLEHLKETQKIKDAIMSGNWKEYGELLGVGKTNFSRWSNQAGLDFDENESLFTVGGRGQIIPPGGAGSTIQDNSQTTIENHIHQQPGESATEVGERVGQSVERAMKRRSMAQQTGLTQGVN